MSVLHVDLDQSIAAAEVAAAVRRLAALAHEDERARTVRLLGVRLEMVPPPGGYEA